MGYVPPTHPDGRTLAREAFLDGLEGAELVPLHEWAAENVVVPDGPRQGRLWSPELSPYLIEPLQCLHPDHPCTRVSVMKSAQLGVSVLAIIWLLYLMDRNPGRLMYVMPTGDSMRGFSSEKLDPMIRACAALTGNVREQKQREAGASKTMFKVFRGGSLILTGANSSKGLRSRTIQFAVADEVDDWPLDLDGQGSPMGMVDARQLSFHASGRYKKLEISTPIWKGASVIEDAYEASDKRVYLVVCPVCGQHQMLRFHPLHPEKKWGGLVWEKGFPQTARYVCEHKGCEISPYQLATLLQPAAGAHWHATAPGAGREPGFALAAVYSRVTTWAKMVAAFEDINGEKDQKTFCNLWLGEGYQIRGDAPEIAVMMARREDYSMRHMPPGCLFLTMAVDINGTWLQWAVYGWGIGLTSWLIDRGSIVGDPNTPGPWQELDEITKRTYEAPNGRRWGVEAVAVDSGYMTHRVYAYCRSAPRLFAVDGRPGHLHPPVGLPAAKDIDFDGQRIKGGATLWPIGTWGMKFDLMAALRLTAAGPLADGSYPLGYFHVPLGVDEGYFQQLTAEAPKLQKVGKRSELVWVKTSASARNEELDLYVYARALACHMGGDKMSKLEWAKLARERGMPDADAQRDLLALWTPSVDPDTGELLADTTAPGGEALPRDSATTAPDDAGAWIDEDEARDFL